MRVAAFTKYDREAASTRQRILQYGPLLAREGIELRHFPLLGNSYVRTLATGENWSRAALLRSYARRLAELLKEPRCDLIWIYAELFPYLPSAFERLAFRSGVPVVYDCDDAFFLTYNESSSAIVRGVLSGKIERLMTGAAAATCGNGMLRDYASRFCSRATLVPTVVDTQVYRPNERAPSDVLTIGWIGSPSTWENVRSILPVIRQLCAHRGVRFRVVGAGYKAQNDQFPGMELVPWSEASEVAEVQGFDIGIMPLVDAPFQRGKSGYKLVQYMACGVPSVGSPVGVNTVMLQDGCGLLARTPGEWLEALENLIDDAALRRSLATAGRERAESEYSLKVHAPRLALLFRETVAKDSSAPR